MRIRRSCAWVIRTNIVRTPVPLPPPRLLLLPEQHQLPPLPLPQRQLLRHQLPPHRLRMPLPKPPL